MTFGISASLESIVHWKTAGAEAIPNSNLV